MLGICLSTNIISQRSEFDPNSKLRLNEKTIKWIRNQSSVYFVNINFFNFLINRTNFNTHLQSHEDQRNCTMCEYTAESSDQFKEHMRDAHDVILAGNGDEDCFDEEEPGLAIPKINSQGKVIKYFLIFMFSYLQDVSYFVFYCVQSDL